MKIEHTAVIGYGMRVATRELGLLRRANGNRPLYDIFPSSKFSRLDYALGTTDRGVNICFVGVRDSMVSIQGSGIGAFNPYALEESVDEKAYSELLSVSLEGQIRRDPAWLLFLFY